MIALYSHWSLPAKSQNNKIHGKVPIEYFLAYLSLSVGYAKLFFDEVVMVTDEAGAKLFSRYDRQKGVLSLPFDHIDTRLEPLTYPANYWAVGKLYAYMASAIDWSKPFVHFDYDSYFHKNIVSDLRDKDVIVQHTENEAFYTMFGHYNLSTKNKAYNTGVFGGSDLDTIGYYSYGAIELAKRLAKDKQSDRLISCIFEQKYLYDFLYYEGITPYSIMPGHADCYCHYWGDKANAGAYDHCYRKLLELNQNEARQQKVHVLQ